MGRGGVCSVDVENQKQVLTVKGGGTDGMAEGIAERRMDGRTKATDGETNVHAGRECIMQKGEKDGRRDEKTSGRRGNHCMVEKERKTNDPFFLS